MKKQLDGQIDIFNFLVTKEIEEKAEIKEKKMEKKDTGSYFEACNKCWCFDCRHNSENEGIPRAFIDEHKPCPSCTFCIVSKIADPCEIGSYDNGCKVRAQEEGIIE